MDMTEDLSAMIERPDENSPLIQNNRRVAATGAGKWQFTEKALEYLGDKSRFGGAKESRNDPFIIFTIGRDGFDRYDDEAFHDLAWVSLGLVTRNLPSLQYAEANIYHHGQHES